MADILLVEKTYFRRQMLASSVICGLSSLVYYLPGFPFDRSITGFALVSAVIYFSLFLFFDRFKEHYHFVLSALSQLTLAAMGFIIHLSGGIASPFLFLYFVILVSEAAYGISTPLSFITASASLWLSVGGEYYGFWPARYPFTMQIYQSMVTTLSFLLAMTAFMFVTSFSMQLIMRHLRAVLAEETVTREAMLRKFSELNSCSQIGVLAHRIVHDLRGPIAFISGYVEMELLKPERTQDTGMLKDLQGLVADMAESLSGITRFGRTASADREKIPLAEFMRTLVAIVSFAPQARDVAFNKLYPENSKAMALTSRSDLQQALFNVIKNAVEAMKDNKGAKNLDISFEPVDECVEILISDNGCGMSREMADNIFKKSITTKEGGTGVGLIITRDLLARNSGTIEFRNRESGGVTVAIRLPVP
jgi:signal transduction histidine kinase